jgi:predicted  nucleic acid-binding Zn ribbon protein
MRHNLRFLIYVYKYRINLEEGANYGKEDLKCFDTCSKNWQICLRVP